MEKFTIDESTYIKVFKENDLQDNETAKRFLKQCEQIIKTYKRVLDTEYEISKYQDKTSNFFLQELKSLAFIIYSKANCEPGKAQPIAFTFFSSKGNEPKWHLELIYKKRESESKFPRLLIQSAFDYLKNYNAEEVVSRIDNDYKSSLKFFEEIIDSGLVKGNIYKADDIKSLTDEALRNYINGIKSDLAKENYECKSFGITEFNYNLKDYTPKIIKIK